VCHVLLAISDSNMARTHRTHRFSQEALNVIQSHQQRTGIANFSEALEDIIKRYGISQYTIRNKFKRFLEGDTKSKPLEAFTHG
jgi:hypothetical protein